MCSSFPSEYGCLLKKMNFFFLLNYYSHFQIERAFEFSLLVFFYLVTDALNCVWNSDCCKNYFSLEKEENGNYFAAHLSFGAFWVGLILVG